MNEYCFDFVVLLAGVPFLALAAVCYTLERSVTRRLQWEWLCGFGCILCLHIWLELSDIVSGGARWAITQNVTLLVAYLCLLGLFLSQRQVRWKHHVLWYAVPAVVAMSALMHIDELGETLITLLVGLPATVLAGLAVWNWAQVDQKRIRFAGQAFAVLFCVIPLTELALGAPFSHPELPGIHSEATYWGYFVNGLMLAGLACTLDSMMLWRDRGTMASRNSLLHVASLAGVVLLTLFAGWILARHLSDLRYSEIRATSMSTGKVHAQQLNYARRTTERLSLALANNKLIVAALEDPVPEQIFHAQQVIDDVTRAFEGFMILLMDSELRPVAGDEIQRRVKGQRLERPHFRQALEGQVTSNIIREPLSGRRGVVSAAPVRSPSGSVIGLASVIRDLEIIENSFAEDSFTLLVSPDGTIWLTSIEEWRYRKLWGQPSDQDGDPSTTSLTGLVEQPPSGGQVHFGATSYLLTTHPAGPAQWTVVSLSPLDSVMRSRQIALLATGAAVVILMMLGVAIRQRTEGLISWQHRVTLEENMRQMERLIGVISHDLRAPLSASRTTVDFLLTSGNMMNAEDRELLTNVGEQQMRMAEMVSRMLDAMRIRSGAMEWSWSEVDIPRVLESARSTVLAMPGRVASVPIELEIAQEVKTILGDAQSVRRLVENLVSNAVRFTRQGRIRIRADLPRRGGQQWLRIRVEDTGEGMDEKTLELLGRPFLLGGAHRGSGSGLGVGICAGICAAHGGMLTVRPRQGEGTTFSAWLRTDLPGPVPTPEEPTVQIVS